MDLTPCPAGTWSDTSNASSIDTCRGCMAGTYSEEESAIDQSSCLPCPPGTYCNVADALPTPCPASTFATTSHATTCTACPFGKVSPVGSNSSQQCLECDHPHYVPPSFIDITAQLSLSTQITLKVRLSKTGRLYCVAMIQPEASPPPQANEIRMGVDSLHTTIPSAIIDIPTANFDIYFPILGLKPSLSYHLYCVADDDDHCSSAEADLVVTTTSDTL